MRRSALIAAALLSGFILTAQIPTTNLMGYWPFNGNANDLSGNLNNGSVNGATLTTDRFGNPNSAYGFDGIDDNILVNHSSTIDMSNSTDFSVSFWVKTYTNPTADGNMMSKNLYGSQSGYGFFSNGTNSGYCTSPGQLSFYVAAGAGGDACANNGIAGGAFLNTWIHITGVFDASLNQAKLYVNGVLQNDIGSANAAAGTNVNLTFGSHPANLGYFKGALDDIRIYKTQLTQSEVTAIFNECTSVAPTNATPPANLQLCEGKTATLSASGTGTINWYSSSTSTLALGTGTAFTTPTLALGQHTFYAQDISCTSFTGSANRAAIIVTVSNGPSMSVNSGVICAGQSFTLAPSGAGNYTFSGSGSNIVSPVTSTQYTVSGVNSSNCIVSAVSQVQVTPGPVLVISGNNFVCAGASINLLASGNVLTYTWSTGALSSILAVTPSVTTTYSVSGTDANGCVGTSNKTILVNPLPVITVAVSDPTVCAGFPVTLNALGAVAYQWTGGVTNNVPFVPAASGSYTVTGTDANGCQNTTAVNVAVQPLPQITVASSTNMTCPGEPVMLAAAGSGTVTWSNGSIGQQITVTPTVTTSYTATITDSEGCQTSALIVQQVDACTGVAELAAGGQQLVLYPNPTNGELVVETGKELHVVLVNALGQTVIERHLNAGKNKIDLSQYPKGVYILQYEQRADLKMVKLIKN